MFKKKPNFTPFWSKHRLSVISKSPLPTSSADGHIRGQNTSHITLYTADRSYVCLRLIVFFWTERLLTPSLGINTHLLFRKWVTVVTLTANRVLSSMNIYHVWMHPYHDLFLPKTKQIFLVEEWPIFLTHPYLILANTTTLINCKILHLMCSKLPFTLSAVKD